MQDVKASRGSRCEVRTSWGHPQQFESIGICVGSLEQESEVRVPAVPGQDKKVITLILFRFSHKRFYSGRPCRRVCVCVSVCVLICETFLGHCGKTFIWVM